MGNQGFTGPSSLLYHVHQPTQVHGGGAGAASWPGRPTGSATFRHRHFRTARLPRRRQRDGRPRAAALQRRRGDARSSQPDDDDEHFYRNAQGDEVVYVSDGERRARVAARRPRRSGGATTSSSRAASCTATASPGARRAAWSSRARGYVRTPHALPQRVRPADWRTPRSASATSGGRRDLQTHDEKGEFPIVVKKDNRLDARRARSPSLRRRRAGTATTIPGRSTSTTSSRASGACTCRRRCTRPSRATAS